MKGAIFQLVFAAAKVGLYRLFPGRIVDESRIPVSMLVASLVVRQRLMDTSLDMVQVDPAIVIKVCRF